MSILFIMVSGIFPPVFIMIYSDCAVMEYFSNMVCPTGEFVIKRIRSYHK